MILQDVVLRPAKRDELHELWFHIYVLKEWKTTDAPFFPQEYCSKWTFRFDLFKRLREGKSALVIEWNGKLVGYVTYYFEDTTHQWLEVGITIFRACHWGKGIGQKALNLWINHVFMQTEIPRVGLTTWSGNHGMMKCAEKIGFQLEGQIRQVRFFEGRYYDAMRYSILRKEWKKIQSEFKNDVVLLDF